MDRRKSLAAPLMENLRSPSGPLRRRSSIPVSSSAVGLIDNDDEAERAALRFEANITSTPNNPPTSNRRSLSLNSIVGGMSQPQIAEGIAECIKLNLQNKINMKNAFSLNMIDFMSYLVRNRDEGISNLQVAGTSLDVSAKIYALRVDALHQDILKMAGNLDHKDKKDDGDGNEENNDPAVAENDNAQQNDEKIQRKKKKKKLSRKIRTTIESLIGENDVVCLTPVMFGEADCQTTDMLYQAMLPQHCNVGLGLHPYKDVILDKNSNSITNNTESRIPWPPVQFDVIRDIITVYSGFEFLNWSNEEEGDKEKSYSQEAPSLIHDDLAFDLDASLPPDEPISNGQNFYDLNDDNEDNAEGYHAEIRTTNAVVDLPNILAKLPDKKLEYSFFSDAVNARWIGPGHWKIKSAGKNLGTSKVMEACRQGAGRKKKELELLFNDDTENCDAFLNVPKRNTTKLQAKTVKTVWSEKKLELPTEDHDNSMKQVCQYFLRPDDIIKFIKNSMNATELPEESAHYDYGNENDTINYSPNDDDDDEDAQVNDDNYQDNGDNMDVDTGGFVGDNLIEAPKLTQKIFIPFSQRAKKLDMRRLKKCIWNRLLCHDQDDKDKENVNINDKTQNDVLSVKGEIKFTNVVADLPKKLNINDAEELSVATAFVSLLHLANEKCLKVHSNYNFSDVIISQDSL
ncbi:hypothetical protein PV325_000004 [Microctonus aethiopoides]|nr:hypothetical protein PV326_006758 [Microctonus aethiopoides]KAK0090838.1 hypothetical protein PV325_000004 [Microctonus aethiopoides]